MKPDSLCPSGCRCAAVGKRRVGTAVLIMRGDDHEKTVSLCFLLILTAYAVEAERFSFPRERRLRGRQCSAPMLLNRPTTPTIRIRFWRFGRRRIRSASAAMRFVEGLRIFRDVVSDLTLNRAFFKASRIKCSNAKEPNGSAIRGFAVDRRDNKLGIRGALVAASSSPKFVEVPREKRCIW